MSHKMTPERRAELDLRIRRRRARFARFTPSPAKPRLGTRGEKGETWRTKRHTPCRLAAFVASRASA